ncbi:MAG: hypothetical protein NTY72_14220 [Bacteroidetes bacterium]|nr:hypothetical protein [Bacteroidota bacterium]
MKLSAFRIVIIFSVFALLAGIMLSKLSISFMPPSRGSILTVSYGLENSDPLISEQSVTSILENSLSTISGIKKQSSIVSPPPIPYCKVGKLV